MFSSGQCANHRFAIQASLGLFWLTPCNLCHGISGKGKQLWVSRSNRAVICCQVHPCGASPPTPHERMFNFLVVTFAFGWAASSVSPLLQPVQYCPEPVSSARHYWTLPAVLPSQPKEGWAAEDGAWYSVCWQEQLPLALRKKLWLMVKLKELILHSSCLRLGDAPWSLKPLLDSLW